MRSSINAAALYLHLAALGADLSPDGYRRDELRFVLSREAEEDLEAIVYGQGDADLDAIREEARR